MSESLGAKLRRRREEQQIALATIGEQTKIKQSLLEALERDDVSKWPAGIFGRAFVRAYAHAIGLQPDAVLKEFLEQHPEHLEEVAPVEAIAEAVATHSSPPTRFQSFFGVAVGSLSSRLKPSPAQKPVARIDEPQPAVMVVESALESASELPTETSAPIVDVPASPIVEPVPVVAAAQPQPVPEVVSQPEPIAVIPAASEPDLSAAAYLCTEFGRLEDTRNVAPLLQELARLLDAVGLIVWVWDAQLAALVPTLPCGYSESVLAQLPKLSRDARNATAAAFRSGLMSVVSGGEAASDALVVPLMVPAGCAGVLAIELPHGASQKESLRALATIFGAQMARLIGAVRPASRRLA